MGVLYGRYELLDQLRVYKVRPAEDVPPHKFETGTKNHEGLAGTTAAIDYLADIGAEYRTLETRTEARILATSPKHLLKARANLTKSNVFETEKPGYGRRRL